MDSFRSCVFAILISSCAFVPSARAGEIVDSNHTGDGHHVRTPDARIRDAITSGVERSPFFRDLVAQLDASDVIVYVQIDRTMPPSLQGRLGLLSTAGGRRYIMVRIACSLTGTQQIAIIGHELQHAVEIANAESVVDEESLAAEYRKIGFGSRALSPGAGYDSQAAIDAGQRVWRELTHKAE